MKRTLIALALLLSLPAHAYYGVLDNGEILAKNQYKFTGDLQWLTSRGGLNVAARADIGYLDEFGARLLVGSGATDIFAGGMIKWMPIPDLQGQPAIGLNGGLIYARDNGNRDLTFRLEPLVSKKFTVDDMDWTPYASLPIGLRSRDNADVDNRHDVTWQFVAGTQLLIPQVRQVQFIGEFGVDLGNALSHISVGAIYYLDGNGSKSAPAAETSAE